MSLLDDARRLAAHDLRDRDDLGYGFCPLCERAEGHNPDCPWLAMPKIVAALEDHERCARRAAQVDAALKLARVDLDADEWPDGLAACDVIDKYLVSPAVRYIDELESELERLKGAVVP